jgi:hypothetical protein
MILQLTLISIYLESFYIKISIEDLNDVAGVTRVLRYREYLESSRIRSEAVVRSDSKALAFLHFDLRLELKVHRPVAGFYRVIKHILFLLN